MSKESNDNNINSVKNNSDNIYELQYEESSKRHAELCASTEQCFHSIFQKDILMKDISYDVTAEEVLAQIAVLKGQSITVYIQRGILPKFKIVIPESKSTVAHLKKAIQRYYENDLKRQNKRNLAKSTVELTKNIKPYTTISNFLNCDNNTINTATKISWKYIWRTYFLEIDNNDGTLLRDNHCLLSNYGVRNKCVLKFAAKTKRNNSRR